MYWFGLAVIACTIQVSLAAGFVLCLYRAGKRYHPVYRRFLAASGMCLTLVLTVLAFSPYPNWLRWLEQSSGDGSTARGMGTYPISNGDPNNENSQRIGANFEIFGDIQSRRLSPVVEPVASENDLARAENGSRLVNPSDRNSDTLTGNNVRGGSSIRQQLREWVAGVGIAINNPSDFGRSCTTIVGMLCAFGAGIGVFQFAMGVISAKRFRRTSVQLTDSLLGQSLDMTVASLSHVGPVELRESGQITTPATVGWRKPVVVLPQDWRIWSDEERFGVLAHEVAHIKRSDYFFWALAQCVLGIHFFNPLIHLLANCLKLEQELVADSEAATAMGSQKLYLELLANMALRRAEVPPPVPLRTFLPRQGMLLARVDVLRIQPSKFRPSTPIVRAMTVGILFVVGFLVAGIRIGVSNFANVAASDVHETSDLTLDHVPESSIFVVTFRPYQVMANLDPDGIWGALKSNLVELPATAFEQVTLFATPAGNPGNGCSGFVLKLFADDDAKWLAENVTWNSFPAPLFALFGERAQTKRPFVKRVGDRHVIVAIDEVNLELATRTSPDSVRDSQWSRNWSSHPEDDVRMYVSPSHIPRLWNVIGQLPGPFQQLEDAFRSSNRQIPFLILGWSGSDFIKLRCQIYGGEVVVGDGRQALGECARSAIDQIQNEFDQLTALNLPPSATTRLINNGRELALSGKVNVKPDSVELTWAGRVTALNLGAPSPNATPLEALINGPFEETLAEFRQGAMKRLVRAMTKQISKTNELVSPFNSHKAHRSCRVDLLPHLAYASLFAQFRSQEPWDSPANLLVLGNMPDVYRQPWLPGHKTHISFPLLSDGSEISAKAISRQLPDGAIFAFASSRIAIPWTAPDPLLSDALELKKSIGPGGASVIIRTPDYELITADIPFQHDEQ